MVVGYKMMRYVGRKERKRRFLKRNYIESGRDIGRGRNLKKTIFSRGK